MRFSAQIVKGSAVDRMWRQHSRLSAMLGGVQFRLSGSLAGGAYVAEALAADDLRAIRNHPAVTIATVTEPTGRAAPATFPMHAQPDEPPPRGHIPTKADGHLPTKADDPAPTPPPALVTHQHQQPPNKKRRQKTEE